MKLFNISIDSITKKEAVKRLDKPQVIFTPNPEILLEARRNKKFSAALRNGTLLLPDGHGLLLVSTLLQLKSKILRAFFYLPALFLFLLWKKPFQTIFPEVIHGSDFMDEVVNWAQRNNKSVYFLGGHHGVAEKTANYFKEKFSNLKVAGFSELDPSEAAFKVIKESKAEVLFVAYGAPKQELWISEYFKKIPRLYHVMAVGGSFDFYSGRIQRAPKIMRSFGLEWIWRLILNPLSRLKRIWNATVKFPFLSLFFA